MTLVVATLGSRTGLALAAIRDAEDAAARLGVHVRLARVQGNRVP